MILYEQITIKINSSGIFFEKLYFKIPFFMLFISALFDCFFNKILQVVFSTINFECSKPILNVPRTFTCHKRSKTFAIVRNRSYSFAIGRKSSQSFAFVRNRSKSSQSFALKSKQV